MDPTVAAMPEPLEPDSAAPPSGDPAHGDSLRSNPHYDNVPGGQDLGLAKHNSRHHMNDQSAAIERD
jgi:hypothetical protein